jgi:hypothetical protein
MGWTRESLGDLVIDEEYSFITEHDATSGMYRSKCAKIPDLIITGSTAAEVWEKARREIRDQKAAGRLPVRP